MTQPHEASFDDGGMATASACGRGLFGQHFYGIGCVNVCKVDGQSFPRFHFVLQVENIGFVHDFIVSDAYPVCQVRCIKRGT